MYFFAPICDCGRYCLRCFFYVILCVEFNGEVIFHLRPSMQEISGMVIVSYRCKNQLFTFRLECSFLVSILCVFLVTDSENEKKIESTTFRSLDIDFRDIGSIFSKWSFLAITQKLKWIVSRFIKNSESANFFTYKTLV